MNFIAKILPVDGYKVDLRGELSVDFSVSLTHLYQPIIGSKPVMLYLTLLHEMDFITEGKLQTHHTLMNYLCLPLDEIYEAREKLEGIGLLQTFENKREGQTTFYEYELQIPFSPKMFLNEPMLSQLLYYHIGKQKFKELQSRFHSLSSVHTGQEITASFNDVFDTVKPVRNENTHVEQSDKKPGPKMEQMDFSDLVHALKQRMIPVHRVLTSANQRVITQMAALHQLTSFELENCLLWSLTADNEVDIEAFKAACMDVFRSGQQQSIVHLQDKQQASNAKNAPISGELKKGDKLIQEMETMSPQQLLADLSSGKRASEQDMKIIGEVMTTTGLPNPVMNVLIHYVLLQTDMKLSKAYLETIASHWSRANLQTAKEAMAFAKRQQQKYDKPVKKSSGYRQYSKKKQVVPEWINDNASNKNNNKHGSQKMKINAQKEKDELLAFINQYAEKKKG